MQASRVGVKLTILIWIGFVHGSDLSDLPEAQVQRRLVDGLPLTRPIRNHSEAMHVKVKLHPLCLKELNVAKQELSLVAGLTMIWENKFLAWDPREYDGLMETYIPSASTWKPLFQISNSVTDAANNEDASQSQYILIDSNGLLTWSMSRKFQTNCNVDVVYFPFDTQYCCITITNWLSASTYTQFIPKSIDTAILINSTEWNVLNVESFAEEINVGGNVSFRLSKVNFCLKLQRRSNYYVLTIIMPLFLLSFVGLFVFPLPPASGEKISLSVACLMSFSITQVSISAHLPTSWNSVPLIMIVNILFMVMDVLCVCVTVLNLHIYLKEESNNKSGLKWKGTIFGKVTECSKNFPSTDGLQARKDSENLNGVSACPKCDQSDVSVLQDNQLEISEKTGKGHEKRDHAQKKWKDQAILLNNCLSYVFVSIFLLLLTISGILWFQQYQSE